jgi:hypothetical protein
MSTPVVPSNTCRCCGEQIEGRGTCWACFQYCSRITGHVGPVRVAGKPAPTFRRMTDAEFIARGAVIGEAVIFEDVEQMDAEQAAYDRAHRDD